MFRFQESSCSSIIVLGRKYIRVLGEGCNNPLLVKIVSVVDNGELSPVSLIQPCNSTSHFTVKVTFSAVAQIYIQQEVIQDHLFQ